MLQFGFASCKGCCTCGNYSPQGLRCLDEGRLSRPTSGYFLWRFSSHCLEATTSDGELRSISGNHLSEGRRCRHRNHQDSWVWFGSGNCCKYSCFFVYEVLKIHTYNSILLNILYAQICQFCACHGHQNLSVLQDLTIWSKFVGYISHFSQKFLLPKSHCGQTRRPNKQLIA